MAEVGNAYLRISVDPDQVAAEVDEAAASVDGEEAGSGIGVAMGAAIAAGIAVAVAGAAALISEAIDLDAANDALRVQLGLSAEDAEAAGRVAGELYTSAYGESIGEVNDLIASVIGEGLGSIADEGALETLTAQTFDFANAMGVDGAEAVRAMGQLVRTGLADDGTEALDLLTRGFQSSANLGGDLLDVLGEYGTTFGDLGLEGEDAIGLLNQALAGGAPNADFAADAFREFSIIVTEGSDEARAAAEAIGLPFDELQRQLAEGDPQALLSTIDALREIEDPLARDQAAIALFGTQIEDLGAGWLTGIAPGQHALEDVAGAAAETSAIMGDNLGVTIESFKREVMFTLVEFVEQRVLPILQDLAAWWQEHWPAMQATLREVVEWIQINVAPLIGEMAAAVQEYVGALIEWWNANWPQIREAVQSVVDGIMALWDRFGGAITVAAQVYFNYVKTTIENVMAAIREVINLVLAIINGEWGQAWDALRALVGIVFDQILNIVETALRLLWAILPALLSAIADVFTAAMNGLEDAARAGVDAALEWLKGLPQRIVDAWVNLHLMLAQVVEDALRALIRAAATVVREDVIPWFEGLPGRIGDSLLGIVDAMYHLGVDLIGAIVDGIASAPSAIVDAISDLIPGGGLVGRAAGVLGFEGFAEGGYVARPTFAMIGEAGPELVLPLTNPSRMAELLDGIGGSSGARSVHITTNAPVDLDERRLREILRWDDALAGAGSLS